MNNQSGCKAQYTLPLLLDLNAVSAERMQQSLICSLSVRALLHCQCSHCRSQPAATALFIRQRAVAKGCAASTAIAQAAMGTAGIPNYNLS